MSVLLLMACVGTLCLVNGANTSTDKDAVLQALLALHQETCGDAARCNSSYHVEPSKDMYPTPCCLPCSCLPTCRTFQNCCPDHLINSQNNDLTFFQDNFQNMESLLNEGSSPKKGENNFSIVDTTNQPGVQRLLTKSKPDSFADEILGNLSALNYWDSSDSSFTSEPRIMNNVLQSSTPNLTVKTGIKLRNYTDNRMREDVKTICTRPQILRDVNKHLDSQAYEMIGSCLPAYSGTLIEAKCLTGFQSKDLYNMIPVTSILTGLTYGNKNCFLCNEADKVNKSESVYTWKPVIKMHFQTLPYMYFETPQQLVSKFNFRAGNVHFLPPAQVVLKRCQYYDVGECNQTGLWNLYSEQTKNVCKFGPSLLIANDVSGKRMLYKNAACLQCNTNGNITLNQLSCGFYHTHEPLNLIAMSIVIQNVSFEEPEDNSYDNLVTDSTIKMKNDLCKDGYISVWNVCRKIFCPRNYYIIDGKCAPLFDTLSGLRLNLKLEIIPSQTIATPLQVLFAERLKNLINSTLEQTVHLQRSDVSLWFLRRSQMNSNEAYIFNIYLIGPDNLIKYDDAINGVRSFYQSIRKTASISLENGQQIHLIYNYAHRFILSDTFRSFLDLKSGDVLSPLMEKGWRLEHLGPSVKVSDVDWCYRTVLTKSEVQTLSRYTKKIQQSNIVLYFDQFDESSLYCLTCINYLSDLIVNSAVVIKSVPSSSKAEAKNRPWYSNNMSAMTIFVIVGILLGILVFTIKSKIRQNAPNIREAEMLSSIEMS